MTNNTASLGDMGDCAAWDCPLSFGQLVFRLVLYWNGRKLRKNRLFKFYH